MVDSYDPVQAMIDAIAVDQTIDMNTQLELAPWYSVLTVFKNNPPVYQAGWQALIAANSSSWLTNDLQTLIENYAFCFNVPLIPT